MSDLATSRGPAPLYFGMRGDRLAVSALFLVNGFLVGSWAPKIPVLMARLDITESIMGLLILVFGLGSIAMMPVIGALTARHGSAPLLKPATLALLPMLFLLTLAPELITTAVVVFVFGGLIGGMDVAMNTNAVAVEKRMKRAIMSSCHGFWSLGALLGAALGGVLLGSLGEIAHGLIVTVLATAAALFALPLLAQDQPTPETKAATPLKFPRSPLPYLVGIMALFSMIPEGAILDWSALFLQREHGAGIELAALGFAAFSATMAIMRFAGDIIRQKLGAVLTLRICGGFALTGMVLAALAPVPELAILGFAIAGIGISNIVPIAFSAAGNLPGIPSGIGLSIVTVMGYSGILVAPSAIGFIAEHTGFSPVLMGTAALVLVTLGLSSLARYANFSAE
ncbi:MFS transporter [Pelagibacterium halotolerans]|uniref:Putative membrane protein n=1 Tax=Pelagibacterium halotolerans (strain DSM 22347 / JCM 15775 / CGMCC 1.7692 / B2) TaxID=1082931 RepID=G4R9R3_PELHB|nr:MFS transporter [Pelagibacterium halotolerans]AEQ51470.1 putative membrane protein [Pelagibacterium halotolerans B2]QJR18691.1 MFS transporter [Pelagibacterium halotolerans]SEA14424.1 Predicted arabinose efflux permease, MFS family [Pelagibacterium halotolerans]